jgi:hypothetical protein
MENEPKKELTKEEKLGSMEADIFDGIMEVKDLLPELGHGEAKRLLIAALSYPYTVEDFTYDSEAMRKAYSATKRIKDSMIALGVEVTLENMVKQAMANGEITSNEAFNPNVTPEGDENV